MHMPMARSQGDRVGLDSLDPCTPTKSLLCISDTFLTSCALCHALYSTRDIDIAILSAYPSVSCPTRSGILWKRLNILRL